MRRLTGWLIVGLLVGAGIQLQFVSAQGGVNPLMNLLGKVNGSNELVVAFGTGGTSGQANTLANLRGKVNSSNELLVAVGSGAASFTADGDCSAPPITFVGDTDTGIDRTAANTLALCTSGTARLTINTTSVTSTLPFYAPAGAVDTPSYTFNDADTGFYAPTANNIGISNAGVNTWRFNGLGNLAAQGAYSVQLAAAGSFDVAAKAFINTAPTSPVACTSPAVTNSNGTVAFQIDVGSTCTGVSTLVVTMPAATNAWAGCKATHVNSPATRAIDLTSSTTTSVTFTNYSRTLGTAADWTDNDDVRVGGCIGG